MIVSFLLEQSPLFLLLLIAITFLVFLLIICLCISLCVHRKRSKQQSQIALANKRLLYSSPASLTPSIPTKATDRYVFPLPRLQSTEIYPQQAINDISSSYKTFDLPKQRSRHISSDSSYTSSNQHRSQILPTKIQRHSTPPGLLSPTLETISAEPISPSTVFDSDDDDDVMESPPIPSAPPLEYTLADVFRFELTYKLYYSLENNQLLFQLIDLKSMQSSIDRCFPSIICQIRIYTSNNKHKMKKYFSKKNPTNEIFKFDLDQYTLEQSYLKIHVFGQHKHDKRLDLGHIALILNQYENLVIRIGQHHDGGLLASPQHVKYIPIDEDRIDMITQLQLSSENEARALISLVYEDHRCLLHVGLIKILGIQTLLKPSFGHFQHRDFIQIKICTIIDGKINEKNKSKILPIERNALTFSSSFHFDYLSLHKTSIRITISYRKTLMTGQNKILSMIEFGSTQLKNQQGFQHWSDTLAAPNRPHIHWHILQPISIV